MDIGVYLYRNRGLLGSPIRWQTRSPYSHASINSAGLIYEARTHSGVRVRMPDNSEDAADRYAITVNDVNAIRMDVWLQAQVGKPYDFTMVLRFLTRRQESRRSCGKWFCSELVYAAFHHIGIDLLANTEPWEVSPGLLGRSPLLRRTTDAVELLEESER